MITSQHVEHEIRQFLGQDITDYGDVRELVGDYIMRFGTVHIDDIPESEWVPFLQEHDQFVSPTYESI